MSVKESAIQAQAFLQQSDKKMFLHRHALASSLVQFGFDVLLTMALLYSLVLIKVGSIPNHYVNLGILTALLMLVVYRERGIYNKHYAQSMMANAFSILKAWGIVIVALVIIAFVTKQSAVFSREVILVWFTLGCVVQIAIHTATYYIARETSQPENALIIGAGEISQYLTERINGNPWMADRIVGVVDNDDQALLDWRVNNVPSLGGTLQLKSIISQRNITALYISLPIEEMALMKKIHLQSLGKNLNVYWLPPVFDMDLVNPNIKQIGNVMVFSLSENLVTGHRSYNKKLLDYGLSISALVVLSPLLLLTALAIKLTSRGPLLFKQQRHGWRGEVFNVWKFRSMRTHKESDGEITQASQQDPRITAVGRFIRKTSIDELPQLFNVLNGTMSLVGPRPHAVEHNQFYSKKIEDYMARHNIKPGLTGLAQVNNCRGETKTVDDMRRRVEYDLEYINTWSNKQDIKIIIKTLFVLFSDKAY